MSPEALREWRKSRGLTQIDLSTQIGVSLATLKRWEAGTIRIPKLLELYCEAN